MAVKRGRRRGGLIGAAVLLAALAAYLAFAPSPVDPVAWRPAPDLGYVGDFAPNERLAAVDLIPLEGFSGPEDLARGPDGALYMSAHEGAILRLGPDDAVAPLRVSPDGALGRPLGIEFGHDGALYVADAYRGLLRLRLDGAGGAEAELLLDRLGETLLGYANDLDVAPDGVVYVTLSTMRFPAEAYGGTLAASILDIAEHRATGRLLAYDPATARSWEVAGGFAFANGLAVAPDGAYALVSETAAYRVWRVTLRGPNAGAREIVLDGTPGFPDNIQRDGDRFWVGLVSPRRAIVDLLAPYPKARRMLFRLPAWMRPGPGVYGHIVAIDGRGRVLDVLQDPDGLYPATTGALAHEGWLYVSSLTARSLARLPESAASD